MADFPAGVDFTIKNSITSLLRGEWLREVSVQIQADNIAAENEEVVCFQLKVLRGRLHTNEFLKDTVCVYIRDSTGIYYYYN